MLLLDLILGISQNALPFLTCSPVAQLVERLTVNQLVAGSSPARGANILDQGIL